jgi:hypothetical protein
VSGFLHRLEQRCGRDFAQAGAAILAALRLPDAAEGEYVAGCESDLILLDDYGLVLRAGLAARSREHPRILAPLRATGVFTNESGARCVIELLPGIRGGVLPYKERYQLVEALAGDGIDFWDEHIENCGYLPPDKNAPRFPYGMPVVLDRGAVVEHGAALSGAFNLAACPDSQSRLYAPLHEKLETAWPAAHSLPRAPLDGFRAACRAEIEAGRGGAASLLSNQWENPERPGNFHDPDKALQAVRAGQAYARRLAGDARP